MQTPMFIESNGAYAIQMNAGGSSQPYHTGVNPGTYPTVTQSQQDDVRYCAALTRDPVACVKQVLGQLPIPAGYRWPTSGSTTWTPSIREQYRFLRERGRPLRTVKKKRNARREHYMRQPLRAWIGEYQLSRLLNAQGLPQ